MIDLYLPDRAFNLPSISPPCMKLEGFLRVADIPHQVIFENDPRKGPKGKVPFINDNGNIMGDSDLIIDYLESKLDFKMNGHLSTHQQAVQDAFCRMLDEHLYFALVYTRWQMPDNAKTLLGTVLEDIPPPISTFLGWIFKRGVIKMLHGQGIGRFSEEEMYQKCEKDIWALSEILGDHDWFGGDYISKLDLSAVAWLSSVLVPEMPSKLADIIKATPNLVRYTENAREAIFPGEFKKERRIPGQSVKLKLD